MQEVVRRADRRVPEYSGAEIGPIRPPSEAGSLYVRVARGCPWNKCRFCPLYKGQRFSRRPAEHVLRDIDRLAREVDSVRGGREAILCRAASTPGNDTSRSQDRAVSGMVARWVASGGRTVFLQDADALAIAYDDLLDILRHIRQRLPSVRRVTSYARSRSVLRLSPAQLAELRAAGLGRIHVGFESGSDRVLAFMEKGATRAMHLEAGLRIRHAGIELSAYYMPGLGGKGSEAENAIETADLIRRVVPNHLRLRSLTVADQAPLAADVAASSFSVAGDVETVREILVFLEHVGDIPCHLVSDHAVNLLSGLSGDLATHRRRLMTTAQAFLSMEPGLQRLFMVGRRMGVFVRLQDMEIPSRRAWVEAEYRRLGATKHNVDALVAELVKQSVTEPPKNRALRDNSK